MAANYFITFRKVISKFTFSRHVYRRNFSSKLKSPTGILTSALENYKDVQLAPIKIKNCGIGVSFSDAFLEHEQYSYAENGLILCENFSKIFEDGFNVLHQSIESVGLGFFDSPAEHNGTEDFYYALAALRNFLLELDHHEKCLKHTDPYGDAFDRQKEVYVAVLLANHLLSRLVYGSRYLVTSDYNGAPAKCPCLKPLECASLINYGQIGLGCEDIWFGRPDIVLVPPKYPNIPVWLLEEDVEFLNGLEEEKSAGAVQGLLQQNNMSTDICEIKLKFEKSSMQILSQAITFAFYEANLDNIEGVEGVERSTLIPSLVITPKHYLIVMYDFENDILLSSDHQVTSLWDETGVRFNRSAILQIWMVLNHTCFRPRVSFEYREDFSYSCGFHKILYDLEVFDKTKQISYRPYLGRKYRRSKVKQKQFMLYSDYKKLGK